LFAPDGVVFFVAVVVAVVSLFFAVVVILAKAGIHFLCNLSFHNFVVSFPSTWIPAFAGMTADGTDKNSKDNNDHPVRRKRQS
jgi:hypothetical protein